MKLVSCLLTIAFVLNLAPSLPTPSNKSAQCLDEEEQKLYELIMEYRLTQKLGRIPLSPKLTRVAQAHAKDLAEHYDTKNTRCNLHSWSNNGKWTPCCYTDDHKQARCMWDKPKEIAGYAGHGYEISYFSTAGANAEEGLAGWKKSKGHNEVIINQGIWKSVTWNAVGIGLYNEYGVVWFGKEADTEACN